MLRLAATTGTTAAARRRSDRGGHRRPAADAPGDVPTIGELEAVWTTGVLAGLPVKIRSKWRAGRWVDPEGGELRFSVPNAWHKSACDDARLQVEQALARTSAGR